MTHSVGCAILDQNRTNMIIVVVPVITKKPMLEKVVDQADT